MRELTITLRVKPTGKMKKEEYRFLADPFSFTPSITDSVSGKLFDCSKDITIETPDVDTLREFPLLGPLLFICVILQKRILQ